MASFSSFLDSSQPLGLPNGSVRAYMAIFMLTLTGFAMYDGVILPDWWILTVQGVTAMYFTKMVPEVVKGLKN